MTVYDHRNHTMDSPVLARAKKFYCKLHQNLRRGGVKHQSSAMSIDHQHEPSHADSCGKGTEKQPLDLRNPTAERSTAFRGNMCRKEAEERLLAHNKDGTYVIRSSSNAQIPYVLSVLQHGKVYHMTIRQDTSNDNFMLGHKRENEPVFQSLFALISCFEVCPIHLNPTGSQRVLLKQPLPYGENEHVLNTLSVCGDERKDNPIAILPSLKT